MGVEGDCHVSGVNDMRNSTPVSSSLVYVCSVFMYEHCISLLRRCKSFQFILYLCIVVYTENRREGFPL